MRQESPSKAPPRDESRPPRYRSPNSQLDVYRRVSLYTRKVLAGQLEDWPHADQRRIAINATLATLGKSQQAALLADAGGIADWQSVRQGRVPPRQPERLALFLVAQACRHLYLLTHWEDMPADEIVRVKHRERTSAAAIRALPLESLQRAAQTLREERLTQKQADGPEPTPVVHQSDDWLAG